jgi:3,4-dihydroxy-2-butanone 4-phosphate synthase
MIILSVDAELLQTDGRMERLEEYYNHINFAKSPKMNAVRIHDMKAYSEWR